MKRIRITSDGLNTYGSRVLTAGMIIEQYQKNPVLLYMHERGQVIGFLKDIQVEEGAISGEPVFDEATELSKRCKKQYEFGSLRMASVGLDVLETSEDPAVLLQGQTRPTITKCKLFEVSMVDIGANDDAIRLYKDGKCIELGKGGECQLPMITNKQQLQNKQEMEQKTLALLLGLPETADEAAIRNAVATLKKQGETNASLKAQVDAMNLAAITQAVDGAVADHRLDQAKKETFVNLGKNVGLDELNKVLGAMQPQQKLSAMINTHEGGQPSTYAKLSDVPSEKLMELRSEDPAEYKRLYKAEYGVDCEL
ncbi:MAG: HK97 family phage prohead protease [Bacteroidales bacterium]|nr:HK97 family phage prohead protease [Bacteroidales bacterium]